MKDYTKKILLQTGFTNEVEKVNQGKCPICNKSINIYDFKDRLSLKEYHISGMCQKCQNKIFI